MSAIAGIASPGKTELVNRMLDKISHRGTNDRLVVSRGSATLGATNSEYQKNAIERLKKDGVACDDAGGSHITSARPAHDDLLLARDELGVMPLYYGHTPEGELCFAAEVKALLEATDDIHELPPGHHLRDDREESYFELDRQPPLRKPADEIAADLRSKLEESVRKRIRGGQECGSLLSGGLDSSAIAALARPHVSRLHTFAAGTPDAPDLAHARDVAAFIDADHHEAVVELDDLLAALPDVIYHLESFDALLVRSSLTHYLVARLASDYVPAVFSGEGGDELFAGYAYLKGLAPGRLPDELLDITGRLHNTALQRVDRCTSAHGIIALVAFLDPQVVSLAIRIPADYKLRGNVEKWILRRALDDLLPEAVVNRPKAKFWEGAGVGDMLSQYAEEQIDGRAFARERQLPNGITLNSKEELLYYRIFRGHFGELDDLSWVGRTKGSPVE
jgi:asparagine synthase (glutamine-hydrolysing)